MFPCTTVYVPDMLWCGFSTQSFRKRGRWEVAPQQQLWPKAFCWWCCYRLKLSVAPGKTPFEAAQHHFLGMNSSSSLETAVPELGDLFVTSFSASQREYLPFNTGTEERSVKATLLPLTKTKGKPESSHHWDIVISSKKSSSLRYVFIT